MRQALYNIPHLFTLIFSLLPHSSLLPFLPSRCITNPAPSLLSTRRTIVCPIHPRHTPELSKPQFYRNPRRPLQRLRRLPYHHPHLRIHPPRITSVDNQPGIIPRQYGSESIDARFADRVINSRLRLSETFLLCFPSFYRFSPAMFSNPSRVSFSSLNRAWISALYGLSVDPKELIFTIRPSFPRRGIIAWQSLKVPR